jgi:hypothetical protein
MKAREAASLLVFGVLAVVLCAPFATAGAALNLESDYVNKVLTLRHFYTGNHLSFATDGTLIGLEATGPWTLDGRFGFNGLSCAGKAGHPGPKALPGIR